jgi:hypothetical protein
MSLSTEEIARVAHEINRAFCQSIGDETQVPWSVSPSWQKASVINGVIFHQTNPSATPEASHEVWMKEKELSGWKFGPVKDVAAKEHPCMVPYADLPQEQRSKDYLFRAVIHSLTN